MTNDNDAAAKRRAKLKALRDKRGPGVKAPPEGLGGIGRGAQGGAEGGRGGLLKALAGRREGGSGGGETRGRILEALQKRRAGGAGGGDEGGGDDKRGRLLEALAGRRNQGDGADRGKGILEALKKRQGGGDAGGGKFRELLKEPRGEDAASTDEAESDRTAELEERIRRLEQRADRLATALRNREAGEAQDSPTPRAARKVAARKKTAKPAVARGGKAAARKRVSAKKKVLSRVASRRKTKPKGTR